MDLAKVYNMDNATKISFKYLYQGYQAFLEKSPHHICMPTG
jgi:hypothetical protein